MKRSSPIRSSDCCKEKPEDPAPTQLPDDLRRANPPQLEAICHHLGPCEVLAGPGSGKTYVLVQRILFLIREKGVPPSQILVLTFSREAAEEMQRRYREQCHPKESGVTFGTFHSVFYRIYRISSQTRPSLINSSSRHRLMTNLILRYLHREPREGEISDVVSMIARTKATGYFPADGTEAAIRNFRQIYEDYNSWLQDHDMMDFEDMILACSELLQSRPGELRRWRERFTFQMVDEYQDINAGQFTVLRMLAGEARNLFVVGDDDQSIYGFRGSNPSFMLEFTQYYPEAHVVCLDTNYRCLSDIAAASQKVIRVNRNRIDKPAHASRSGPRGVRIQEFESTQEEYRELCRILSGMTGVQRERCAIILRTHAQMASIAGYLEERGISCRSGGTASAGAQVQQVKAQEKEAFQTVLSYYRMAAGTDNGHILREDLFYVMNRPERTLLRKEFGETIYTEEELRRVYPSGTNEALNLQILCRDLTILRRLTPLRSWQYLTQVIGYHTGSERLDSALTALACRSADTPEFLLALEQTDPVSLLQRPIHNGAGSAGVHILTMHAAKGLEFHTVFLPDLNEGLLPSRRSRTPEAIEEERRLFYVAMTRARDGLYLMYLRGTQQNPRLPTRFLGPLGVKDWR